MRKFSIPILVMTFGLGWLLNELAVMPRVNWLWTLGLAASGIVFLIFDVNKFNFVTGWMFLVSSVSSVLRQLGVIYSNAEIPALFIVLGLLMFIAQILKLPNPKWILEKKENEK